MKYSRNQAFRSGLFLFFVLTAGLSLACWGQAVQAAGPEIRNNYTIPVSFVLFNECTNEYVQFDGTIHFVDQLVVDGAAGVHFLDNFQQRISGVGDAGTRYRAISTANNVENFVSATEFTVVNSTLYASQGPGNENLIAKTLIHITTTPNGILTANILEARLECR